ncbi:MAG: class I SAM-dependent rRNA methyltransferase [Planctomycetota bacterium]
MRLVFGESDGMSGIIVDRYADALSIQLTAAAMAPRLDGIVSHLKERLRPSAIVVRMDEKTASNESAEARNECVYGSLSGPIEYQQNDLRLHVDLTEGQKTGGYLDQSENHAAAAKYLVGKSVLDVCCYNGGFGLVAAARGASSVLGVDSSQRALAAAQQNADRNAIGNIRFHQSDCFELMQYATDHGALLPEGQSLWDAIILDPPRLAGSRHKIDSAMRAYGRLNAGAIRKLKPGGILVTCSCSGRVSRSDFLNMLVDVGRRAGRDITVLESRGASPDHPMRVSCPESAYLKCFICEVA